MTRVALAGLTKRYDRSPRPAVDGVALDCASGTITALVGPSGCGKSTVLRLIAGLLDPDAGTIALDGAPVLALPPERRGAVLMAQDHLLFPHLTVADNVGFGLAMRGTDQRTRLRKIAEHLDLVQLSGFDHRRPADLSGGQAQRVALARALIVGPRVLLLDEPLSNLDPELRDDMRSLIRTVQRHTGITTLFVTHDREEAVAVGDRIALMQDGRILQHGSPEDLFERPAAVEAARFFGASNLVPATVRNGRVVAPFAGLPVAAPDGPVTLAIRPEAVLLGPVGISDPSSGALGTGLVRTVDYRGSRSLVLVTVGAIDLEAAVDPALARALAPGATVGVTVAPSRIWPIVSPPPDPAAAG